jgi:hypothetical protein
MGAMSLMADYTRSGGISTAKARRKDSAARNKALGLATRGRTRRGQPEGRNAGQAAGQAEGRDQADASIELAILVPQARAGKPRRYVMVEHRRRDTGAVAQALDLSAPDAPRKRVVPIRNDDDVLLEYAVVCVTHDSPPVHVATASRARRDAKWSHKWCDDCRGDQARTPAARSKARRS